MIRRESPLPAPAWLRREERGATAVRDREYRITILETDADCQPAFQENFEKRGFRSITRGWRGTRVADSGRRPPARPSAARKKNPLAGGTARGFFGGGYGPSTRGSG
jgi:hypothetical protein